ncbi:MAG TPA: ammonium transporter, partial [Microlunatus sp.]|nr:ammonium transporter [Microlunatus sp.]
VLTSASLVLLMTPGLALFYGGMVRAKSVLNMMMMSFGALALIPVLWVLYGYSLAFGNDVGLGLVGNPIEYFALNGLMADDPEVSLPAMAFVGFQAVFAIITVALISGAIADRAKFGTWMIFVGVWATIVYFPIAHWVFAFNSDDGSVIGGWIANNLGVIDFAGGTAVHINAGAAALALALVLGKRIGFGKEPLRPHNLTLVMLGAGLLWFGWFGFNAGSALAGDNAASVVWVNTLVATAAAILGWLVTERIRDGKATSLGAASGVVAGLVAITPSCSAVSPIGAIIIGAVAGVLSALAVGLKYKLGYDDSLDVVGVHLVSGLWGTIAIGFFLTSAAPAGAPTDDLPEGINGLFYGGGIDQLWRQIVGAVVVMVVSFVLTYLIGLILEKTIGFRVSEENEVEGVDSSEHAETSYDLGTLGGTRRGALSTPVASRATESDTPSGDDNKASTEEVSA